MIQLLYQGQTMTIEEIYDHYPGPPDPDAFAVWFMKSLTRHAIQYHNSDSISKEIFAKQREANRKHAIRGQLVNTYLSSCGKIKKKKRKALKDAYKKSEQYSIDFENACHSDSILRSFSDENDLCTLIFNQFERSLHTLSCISDYLRVHDYYGRYYSRQKKTREEEIGNFIECCMNDSEEMISELLYGESFLDRYLSNYFFQVMPDLIGLGNKEEWEFCFIDIFDYELNSFKLDLLEQLSVSELFIIQALMDNPDYKDAAFVFYEQKRKEKDFSYFSDEEIAIIKEQEEEQKRRIQKNLLSTIPKEYKNLYPLARQMKRKFVLHIGPTNSGKTYQAMNRLRRAGSGIYLAPLRLLAYEQFELLNKEGYACNLITGEEKTLVPGAAYQSSTIELADLTAYYHFAVIDEAQMIADTKRGGAWTAALLGLCAEEIHVCAAPYAEKILIRLIEECGDEYEIIQHERDTLLSVEKEAFLFPKDVRDHDALIVFSKKNVHAVAAELQRKGKKSASFTEIFLMMFGRKKHANFWTEKHRSLLRQMQSEWG